MSKVHKPVFSRRSIIPSRSQKYSVTSLWNTTEGVAAAAAAASSDDAVATKDDDDFDEEDNNDSSSFNYLLRHGSSAARDSLTFDYIIDVFQFSLPVWILLICSMHLQLSFFLFYCAIPNYLKQYQSTLSLRFPIEIYCNYYFLLYSAGQLGNHLLFERFIGRRFIILCSSGICCSCYAILYAALFAEAHTFSIHAAISVLYFSYGIVIAATDNLLLINVFKTCQSSYRTCYIVKHYVALICSVLWCFLIPLVMVDVCDSVYDCPFIQLGAPLLLLLHAAGCFLLSLYFIESHSILRNSYHSFHLFVLVTVESWYRKFKYHYYQDDNYNTIYEYAPFSWPFWYVKHMNFLLHEVTFYIVLSLPMAVAKAIVLTNWQLEARSLNVIDLYILDSFCPDYILIIQFLALLVLQPFWTTILRNLMQFSQKYQLHLYTVLLAAMCCTNLAFICSGILNYLNGSHLNLKLGQSNVTIINSLEERLRFKTDHMERYAEKANIIEDFVTNDERMTVTNDRILSHGTAAKASAPLLDIRLPMSSILSVIINRKHNLTTSQIVRSPMLTSNNMPGLQLLRFIHLIANDDITVRLPERRSKFQLRSPSAFLTDYVDLGGDVLFIIERNGSFIYHERLPVSIGSMVSVVLMQNNKKLRIIKIKEHRRYLIPIIWQLPQYLLYAIGDLLFSTILLSMVTVHAPSSTQGVITILFILRDIAAQCLTIILWYVLTLIDVKLNVHIIMCLILALSVIAIARYLRRLLHRGYGRFDANGRKDYYKHNQIKALASDGFRFAAYLHNHLTSTQYINVLSRDVRDTKADNIKEKPITTYYDIIK